MLPISVVPDAFLRGVVTAVFWLRLPKFPHQSFATSEEALRWAQSRHTAEASSSLGA